MLLDDELPGLAYLKMLCEQIPELEVVRAFNNPITFLKEMNELNFDLCILDIEMPEINGVQLASQIKDKFIIFATAYKNYAAEAYDLDAVDYVQKPIKKERLQLAVQKVLNRVENKQLQKTYIQLNTDKGKSLLYFDKLKYIRSSDFDSRDKTAHLQDNSNVLLKNISFEKLLEMLPSEKFCQINKKELIALGAVSYFSHNEITTHIIQSNGKPLVLILGEKYRKNFLQIINP